MVWLLTQGVTLAEGYVVSQESLSLQPADEAFTLETRVKIYPETEYGVGRSV